MYYISFKFVIKSLKNWMTLGNRIYFVKDYLNLYIKARPFWVKIIKSVIYKATRSIIIWQAKKIADSPNVNKRSHSVQQRKRKNLLEICRKSPNTKCDRILVLQKRNLVHNVMELKMLGDQKRPNWYGRPNPEDRIFWSKDRINRKLKDRIHIWPLIYPLRYSYLSPNIFHFFN